MVTKNTQFYFLVSRKKNELDSLLSAISQSENAGTVEGCHRALAETPYSFLLLTEQKFHNRIGDFTNKIVFMVAS